MGALVTVGAGSEISALLRRGTSVSPNGPLEEVAEAEELIARLERGDQIDAVVLSPNLEEPVRIAQRLHSLDKDVAVLILSDSTRCHQIARALRFAPLLGEDVGCWSVDDPETVAREAKEAVGRTRKRRSYRATIAAASAGVAAISPPRPRAEQYLDRLLDHAPIGVVAVDERGLVLAWNQRTGDVLGKSEREVVGTPLAHLFPEDERGKLERSITGCLVSGEQSASEILRRETMEGRLQFVEATAAALAGRMGERGGMVLLQDVTARKQAEEEIRVRARQRAAVAEFGQWALSETDLLKLMEEAVALISRTLSVEYAKVLELLPKGDALLLKAGIGWQEGLVREATVSAGRDSQAGYTLLSSEPVIVENLQEESRFSGPPLLHDHGVVSGMSVIIRGEGQPYGVLGGHTRQRRTFTRDEANFLQMIANVLAAAIRRKRAEEAIRRSEERFRLLVEGLKDYAIFMMDPDGCITSWNAGAENIFGYREEEIVGRPVEVLFSPEDVQRGAPEQELKKAASEGRAEDERWHVRKDGTRFFASGVVTPLPANGNGLQGFLKAARDITGRVRAREAMREIREAERRRISRDLHDMVLQDLAATLQSLQFARARAKGAGIETDLDREIEALRRAANGLRGAIHDLRLEKEQSLVQGVQALVELNRQMTPERKIRLNAQEGFPEELPEKVRAELLRVIQEALTNVRRHSGARNVEVTLSKEGDELYAEVSDDGQGFDPATVRESVGIPGMRERIAALGGKLEVSSELGKGTRLAVSVPV